MGKKTETKGEKEKKDTNKDGQPLVGRNNHSVGTSTKRPLSMQSFRNREPVTNRHIKFNATQDSQLTKLSNSISTTKYNIFSFFPKYLYEQFRKYWNVYFLMIGMMQQIPDVSPTGRSVKNDKKINY